MREKKNALGPSFKFEKKTSISFHFNAIQVELERFCQQIKKTTLVLFKLVGLLLYLSFSYY
jgi:hypothetical protein